MSLETTAEEPSRQSSAWAFLIRAKRFWQGPDRRKAWLWTSAALVLIFATTAIVLLLNL